MPPVSKRRKLEHSSSSDIEEDAASSNDAVSEDQSTATESEASEDETRPAVRKSISVTKRSPKSNMDKMQVAHTSLLQMQIAELLEEVTPNYASRSQRVVEVIKQVKQTILGIPSRKPLQVAEAERLLKRESGIAIPFPSPRPSKDVKYKFAYAAPTAIDLVGSFDNQTAIRGGQDSPIDLHVTMPSSLFEAKDYLDYRYLYKRDYYLACLAAGLQSNCDVSMNIRFAFQNENDLQPVLVLTAKDSQGSELPPWSLLRILVGPPPDVFKAAQLRPWMANVRPAGEADEVDRRSQADPTPIYNGAICSDIMAVPYQRLFRSVQKSSPHFQEACRLIKVWLRQRNLGGLPSNGGFGSFEASALVALMLGGETRGGVSLLAKDSSSFQIFRAVIQLLATRDVVANPLVLGQETEELARLRELGLPILWDSERSHNILFKMNTSSSARLRLECQQSLHALSLPAPWRFQPTFIAKVGGSARYDYTFEIDTPDDLVLDTVVLSSIHQTLEKALGDRVREVLVEAPVSTSRNEWLLKAKAHSPHHDRLLISIVANPENAARRIDLGPSADQTEASEEFRELWGKKAELRRYKDGTISESVTWSKFEDDVEALRTIVAYMLETRLGLSDPSNSKLLGSSAGQLSSLLHMPSSESLKPFKASEEAFKELETAIQAASGQPLHIRRIATSCAALRYSAVHPSGRGGIVTGEAIMDVIVQYEGSVRWPDDLAAIQRTKVALLLKLGELLESQKPSLSGNLGLENEHQDLLNVPILDVAVKGHLFRLRIHHDREATLLERKVKDKSTSNMSRTTAAAALSVNKRCFIHEPRHNQAIAALIIRFPLLSPAIRLFKMWISAHLLSPYFPPALLELLVAHVFTHPFPFPRPGSLQSAFSRTLSLLARWDWRAEPLLVNLDPDERHPVRAELAKEVTTRLEAWRKVDPAMHRVTMFVASTIEPDGTVWSSPHPSPLAASRLTALARAACTAIEAQNPGYGIAEPASLFAPSLSEFDFVVHLDSKAAASRSDRGISADFQSLTVGEFESVRESAFNPTRLFIQELDRIYGDCIALFHNFGESLVIGGVWNPQAAALREFRVGTTYNVEPAREAEDTEGKVRLNKPATLNEIARLGGELVAKIVRQDVR